MKAVVRASLADKARACEEKTRGVKKHRAAAESAKADAVADVKAIKALMMANDVGGTGGGVGGAGAGGGLSCVQISTGSDWKGGGKIYRFQNDQSGTKARPKMFNVSSVYSSAPPKALPLPSSVCSYSKEVVTLKGLPAGGVKKQGQVEEDVSTVAWL
jgi:hypothetical protein